MLFTFLVNNHFAGKVNTDKQNKQTKEMKTKQLLTYILIGWQVLLYAQEYKSAVAETNAHINFGSCISCELSTDVCGLRMEQNKYSNVLLTYLPKKQEKNLQLS